MAKCELIEDRNERGSFRVEAIVEDGAVEVAIFIGPNALDRAIHFAAAVPGSYYEEWDDPEGWSDPDRR
jgi:hypothetical protein